MARSIFRALFGSKQDRDVKALMPIVKKVNEQESWAKSLSKEDFLAQTIKFKEQIQSKEKTLEDLLPQAFALAREAAYRVLGQRHYDVQIMGATVLHKGKILEMKTGEGKTLTCVPAAYLNALEGKGVHVVTVNDYLAERDSKWMEPVFNYLGLSVGVIISSLDNESRRINYSKDITYGTNNEFGFDYLRDNMKWSIEDKIQPKHHYCIIDEIDSILIDEARTPLIISGQAEDDSLQVVGAQKIVSSLIECEKDPKTNDYYEMDPLARFDKNAEPFDERGDFKLDEKKKSVSFTSQGMNHIEELLQKHHIISGSLYEGSNFEFVHYVTQAVKAEKLFNKEVDYVVQDGQIQIVDEFTGRILHGRRYSDGLHQAIEAKEKIKVLGQNKTLATITFQNFFRMYDKLSGMTGTAETESTEFMKIYNLDVVVIPTNKPIARIDSQDLIYYNEKFKLDAIVKEIKNVHETGQPILVGTVSIEMSEIISTLLRKVGIKHEVLNAKNHAREALIVEEAGAVGAVTVATNMAGRGTDIKLGGSIENMARKICGTEATPEEFATAIEKVKPQWQKQYEKVKSLGGLYILGTERHESRRIDNQLRGRAGRQGDPGSSKFFVSLDDTLMRLFANDNLKNMLGKIGMKDGEPLEHKMLTGSIERAQKKVEERNFEIRKHLLEYDDVLNEQRNYIYDRRDEILSNEHILYKVLDISHDLIDEIVEDAFRKKDGKEVVQIIEDMKKELFYEVIPVETNQTKEQWKEYLKKCIDDEVNAKVELATEKPFNDFLRFHYLRQIDLRWQDHLSMLEELREAVGLRTYAQKNPLVEYKLEGFDIFNDMLFNIDKFMAQTLVRVQIKDNKESYQKRRPTKTIEKHSRAAAFQEQASNAASQTRANRNSNNNEAPVTVKRTTPKVGRNDPCPCGSGKKYKNCHGRHV
ncbi:MAG: preprotein translocase subunit SecA [Sphaerochaetaceae bacterium]|nr:preprotein translocase subunit SecA [Sphaerochaetaceae bacterium]